MKGLLSTPSMQWTRILAVGVCCRISVDCVDGLVEAFYPWVFVGVCGGCGDWLAVEAEDVVG